MSARFMHIEHTDGTVEHVSVEYGKAEPEGEVLQLKQKNNYREVAQVVKAWPLANIKRYWFNDQAAG